jgi:hypothetical protein
MSSNHLNDNGIKSRKLWITISCMLLITLGFLITAKVPALANVYSEYCMWLLGAAALYGGANAVTKHVLAKNSKNLEDK